MTRMNILAIVVAAVAAFVASWMWYSPLLFGKSWLQLRGLDPSAMAGVRPPIWEMVGEFVKTLVVAAVLAHFAVRLGVNDWTGAVQLGLWVWVGFQAMLLMGAVLHEKMPWSLYAIHTGDALVRTVLMSVMLGVWRKG